MPAPARSVVSLSSPGAGTRRSSSATRPPRTPVDGPANNWIAAFGGPAWSRDEVSGRWYLHSFYPEQPDLDWRNPEVVAAMQDALRFWIERGAAGYRVDAIDRLLKDAELRDDPPATEPYGLPVNDYEAKLAAKRR